MTLRPTRLAVVERFCYCGIYLNSAMKGTNKLVDDRIPTPLTSKWQLPWNEDFRNMT